MNAKKAWHFRVRRWAARGHAWVDVILAAILALMVNVLAIRHPLRVDITRARHFSLTPETRRLLARLPGEVRLTVFLGADHELAREVRQLLREYEHAAPRLRVEFVDPHRDLARSKELALQYDVREPNVLVLEAGSRTRLLPAAELAEAGAAPGAGRRFRGEQVLSNALRNLAQPRKAVVYFLTGHGERRLDDFDPYAGYSILARTLEKRHMEVKALAFSGLGAVPADADLLVMAGPTHPVTRQETDMIQAYLNNAGRLLLLADPGRHTGLEALLELWGVRLTPDRVVGSAAGSQHLLVSAYGEHPVTERLNNVTTVLAMPRFVQPIPGAHRADEKEADRPRVSVLAACGELGWVERAAGQNPPVFDPGVDLRGPAPVAVAVEKGPAPGMAVALRPSRLVIIGDSALVANGALMSGHNTAFFMNAMDWLLERDEFLALDPRPPAMIQAALDRAQLRRLSILLVAGGPALALALGAMIWARRRK